MEHRFFPVFVPPEGKKVLVIGGGSIAERRIRTLMKFDFTVVCVSPSAVAEISELAEQGKLTYIRDNYDKKYLKDCYMVLACTDRRQVNRQAGLDAREKNMLVSVCDSREECNFYFPAIAAGEEVTAGIVGSGRDHHATRRAAAAVRKVIEGKAY